MEQATRTVPQVREDAKKVENPSQPSSDDDSHAKQSPFLSQIDLPPVSETSPQAWNKVNEKQLRSALIGACKRMPRNAEAHFHLGLMHMRNGDCEDALRSFQHCRVLYSERMDQHTNNNAEVPPPLLAKMARVRAHAAQAAHLTALSINREDRATMLQKLQRELVAATSLDYSQPSVWNGLAILHLNEGGNQGARDVLLSIRHSFPDYLDALNNLGLAELALGNEEAAITCFQKVILCDREHIEALSNYGVILLRHGMYDAAIRAFDAAVEAAGPDARGLSFACGGLAIARLALGQLESAESAACRAEAMSDAGSKARFAMLRISIYARRVSDAARRGLPFEDANSALASGEAADASPAASEAELGVSASGRGPTREEKLETGDDDGTPGGYDGSAPDAMALEGGAESGGTKDPHAAIDSAVLRLRALARDVKTSSASTVLGAVLRMRHECSLEESGNRNFGAEAAERLVEALEKDNDDATAWVQLALLQLGTGEYGSAKDFSVQAVSRNGNVEAGWNALAVASQLNVDVENAGRAYNTALEVIRSNYVMDGRKRGLTRGNDVNRVNGERNGKREDGHEQGDEGERGGKGLVFPLADGSAASTDGDRGKEESGDEHPEREVEEERLNEAGRNALAAIYNNIGNMKRQEGRSFSEALAAYEKSLKVGGENAIVYNNLGLLYISSGRYSDACNMLDHALILDPHLNCAVSNRLKLTALMRRRERVGDDDGDGDAFIDELHDFGSGGGSSGHLFLQDDDDKDDGDDEDEGDYGSSGDEDENDEDDENDVMDAVDHQDSDGSDDRNDDESSEGGGLRKKEDNMNYSDTEEDDWV